ncbi:MAG: tRNA-intron lyase [Candidatus Geothermarchaeales archaeon]
MPEGELRRGRIVVRKDEAEEIISKGFGEKKRKYLELSPLEALYLVYAQKLTLKEKGRRIEFDQLMEALTTKDQDTFPRFLVYRDLRSRGYVVKQGYGEKIDFLVYERGEYPSKPAKYRVIGVDEGHSIDILKLIDLLRFSTMSKKELKIAVIERRGEVVYYSLKKFTGRLTVK